MLYTDCQSGRTAAIARHVRFAQITCMVGDTSRKVDSQNVPKAPMIKCVESPAGLQGQVQNFRHVEDLS